MSLTNTDTGDTVNITKTSKSDNYDPSEGNLTVEMGRNDPEPRQALITTAVNFLNNEKVRRSTLLQKQQFLRLKGLTPTEIQMACEKAGVFNKGTNSSAVVNMDLSEQFALNNRRPTVFGRLIQILNSISLLSGVVYAIFVFWKKFLRTFLFGGKKHKSVEESLLDIDKKVDSCMGKLKTELTEVKESLTREQRDQTQQFMREIHQFRSDIEVIKGLLLNRKQFPPPLVTSKGTPSIPLWQLSSSSNQHKVSNEGGIAGDNEDNLKYDVDTGTGSC